MSSVELVMAFEIALNDLNTRAALSQHDADVDRLTRELRGSHHG